jgi:hypothetical protein
VVTRRREAFSTNFSTHLLKTASFAAEKSLEQKFPSPIFLYLNGAWSTLSVFDHATSAVLE